MLIKPKTESGLSLVDGLICSYLVLALLMFCAWFKWPVAIALGLLTCYGFLNALAGVQLRRIELGRRAIALIVVVALAWTALAGLGHFFYANLDWITRDAVLRDLVSTPWPPMYDAGAAAGSVAPPVPMILRAPVGYYLPVAALGSVLGLRCADLLLYLWTVIGFALVLWAAASLFETRRERVLCVLLMLLFGGLDLLGFPMIKGRMPALGQHIEWWAEFAQYSSNSTLMFWVPNHALPAWLGLLLALRHWRTVELARMSLMLAAAIALWSPLSAAGLVPFYLAGLNWRRDFRVVLSMRAGLPFLALAGLVGRYITMDTEAIASGWSINLFPTTAMFWVYYGSFCLLEFGLLTLLLLRLRAFDLRMGLAVAILALLPFYHFGPGNDLVMRCSIPALAILALACVRPLAASQRLFSRATLGALLIVGALGASQEPIRALLRPHWDLTGKSLAQVSAEQSHGRPVLPPNYVGRLVQPGLQALLRTPALVEPGGAAASASAAR
jgi:hypothetical protein